MIGGISTGQGDDGRATALSGDQVSKTHPITACVGEADELRAHLAAVRLAIIEQPERDYEAHAQTLLWLIHGLFLVGGSCSDPSQKRSSAGQRRITQEDVARLDAALAKLEARTPLPKGFVASAATSLGAQIDVARTVARRAERAHACLRETFPDADMEHVGAFLNRLSDYLFMLARDVDGGRYVPLDHSQFG